MIERALDFLSFRLFGRRRTQACAHLRGHETKWLDADGTPMYRFYCPDCGAFDAGHVHADPATWLQDTE